MPTRQPESRRSECKHGLLQSSQPIARERDIAPGHGQAIGGARRDGGAAFKRPYSRWLRHTAIEKEFEAEARPSAAQRKKKSAKRT